MAESNSNFADNAPTVPGKNSKRCIILVLLVASNLQSIRRICKQFNFQYREKERERVLLEFALNTVNIPPFFFRKQFKVKKRLETLLRGRDS